MQWVEAAVESRRGLEFKLSRKWEWLLTREGSSSWSQEDDDEAAGKRAGMKKEKR